VCVYERNAVVAVFATMLVGHLRILIWVEMAMPGYHTPNANVLTGYSSLTLLLLSLSTKASGSTGELFKLTL
jgi:hypothetical protein